MSHETRPEARGPLHIVWRIARGLPGLRTPHALRHLDIRRPLRRSPVMELRSYDYIPCVGLDSVPGPSWTQFVDSHVD